MAEVSNRYINKTNIETWRSVIFSLASSILAAKQSIDLWDTFRNQYNIPELWDDVVYAAIEPYMKRLNKTSDSKMSTIIRPSPGKIVWIWSTAFLPNQETLLKVTGDNIAEEIQKLAIETNKKNADERTKSAMSPFFPFTYEMDDMDKAKYLLRLNKYMRKVKQSHHQAILKSPNYGEKYDDLVKVSGEIDEITERIIAIRIIIDKKNRK